MRNFQNVFNIAKRFAPTQSMPLLLLNKGKLDSFFCSIGGNFSGLIYQTIISLQTFEQFENDGCDNCEQFLNLRNHRDNVYDCTSANFDGYEAALTTLSCPTRNISL